MLPGGSITLSDQLMAPGPDAPIVPDARVVPDVPVVPDAVAGPLLLARRRRAAALLAVFCLLAASAGIAAARLVRSPALQAAQVPAPPLSRLTAVVGFGRLTATVVTSGTVRAGPSVSGQPTAEVGAALLTVSAVKTRPGELVQPGSAVAEVSGRPLIALPGAVAAYRDLSRGDRGPDVIQLQRALGAAGYPCGYDTAGVFGRGTRQALIALYAALGYAPAGGRAAYLPLSEVLFVPSFPARVARVDSALGRPLQGPAVTVSYGPPRLAVSVAAADGPLARRGSRVLLTPQGGGRPVRARVISQGAPRLTGTGELLPLRIAPQRPLPLSWAGQRIRVTITSARTRGKVRYVPVAAISASASGQADVTVVGPAGRISVVAVTAGVSADGLVAVTPAAGRQLTAGDRVLVGIGP